MFLNDGTIDKIGFEKYKQLRNTCTYQARQEKNAISLNLQDDPSTSNVWRVANSATNQTKSLQNIPSNLTAEKLNEYFTTKIELL